jgi:SAM-dependent methyltransferase
VTSTPDPGEGPPPAGLNGSLSGLVKWFRIRRALRELPGARSVLDLGSGLCEIVPKIPAGVRYSGVEREPFLLARARLLFPSRRFYSADLEDPGFDPGEPSDRVLLLAVFEHLADPGSFLKRARLWTVRGGRLVLTTPHPRSAKVLELGARWKLLSSAAEEEHEHLYSPEEIRRLAEEAGWNVVSEKRFLFGLNQLVVLERPLDETAVLARRRKAH